MNLMILGASGAVGRHVLEQASHNTTFSRIVAPSRRPLGASAKIDNPVLDFRQPLPEADWWAVDAVICCLGTTRRQAGSKEAFFAIDHDLVLACATAAKARGAQTFVLNSSLGADPDSSNFYLRTKGQTEADLGRLGFRRLVLVRPSLIDAEREQTRLAEQLGLRAARLLAPLIPARYRAVRSDRIAAALLQAIDGNPGTDTIESDQIGRP